ncbi:ATP-binding protein [Streptomyces sp. LX-29]|uniref:ATP-binding protein n=1 Tax=Streptomyces sp. LX-29 TaxID=2900152 RepID=UPI00240E1CBC|nr:ATP-binding protein [Streptomyces sp. LX-29]WFB07794.1 ATP-binding protein [Streptomyces sp. LX-29]
MDEYTSRVRVWGLICPGLHEEVARARRWTRDILSGHPCVDDAELIVSELGTNALIHSVSGADTGTFHITLSRSEHLVVVSVSDSGSRPGKPHAPRSEPEGTHGRGLSIVMTLAYRLDVTGNERGRTVTAELHAPTAGAEAC